MSVLSYKVVLLGDSAVGKSSLVSRFVRDEFTDAPQPTIGAAFLTKTIRSGEFSVKFEIWDTAGQERYRSLAPMYYRGAAAAIIVFDLTDAKSFDGAKSWAEELKKQGNQDIVLALVGNKKDLPNRKIETSDAERFANDLNSIYVETSAKSGENIAKVFDLVAEKLPKKREIDDTDTVMFPGNNSGGNAQDSNNRPTCC